MKRGGAHARRGLRGPAASILGWGLGGSLVVGALAGPAAGYSFRDPDYRIVRADAAPRWAADSRNLRFRLLDNEHGVGFPVSGGGWREAATAAVARWNAVSTSAIRLEMEERTVAREWGSLADGVNTIGFSGFPPLVSSTWPFSINSARIEDGVITACDIELNPEYAQILEEGQEVSTRWLESEILHQLGHCLGLGHTESALESRRFLPEIESEDGSPPPAGVFGPVMSYTSRTNRLAADDRAGVSALYPAPGFSAGYGSVRGELETSFGRPATHFYVRTILPGEPDGDGAREGPGAFADAEGRFLIEGVPPGPTLLVIHPILIRWAHEFRSNGYALDQWRFLSVRAGAVHESLGPPVSARPRWPPDDP